jgi:hypothetical protein
MKPSSVVTAVQTVLQFPGVVGEASEGEGGSLLSEPSELVNIIRKRWEMMRNHRSSSGLDAKLLTAQRIYRGEYSPEQLAEIRRMGGSDVYARIIGTKARGATSILRDIYFSAERPWAFSPTDDPVLPDDALEVAQQVAIQEAQAAAAQGQPVDPAAIEFRVRELLDTIKKGQKEKAEREALEATLKVNDILQEGGFYTALSEVLTDIPVFPFVVLKGPVVRMADVIRYERGSLVKVRVPKLFWQRVSPFDIYWTPGAARIRDAEVCERLHWTRRDLNELIGLPGWDEEAVRAAIRDYDEGLVDFMDTTDEERAHREGRESPNTNNSGLISALEFHGYLRGAHLLDIGFDEDQIDDPDLDYAVTAWVCGKHLLKVALSPLLRYRHPYFVTSMDKIPGTPVGLALPDMLADIERTACAALRALSNNMGIASGPQVAVNADRLSESEDATVMYPWKVWFAQGDQFGGRAEPPIAFFQPQSNAGELLQVYQQMTVLADEISAIPRYITGSGATGGAGRTASGLNMLMQNASKVLHQVAHNIDTDLLLESLMALYDMVMTADAGVQLRGDENIVVKGVTKVIAKETERVRQLEFLSLTSNPIDMQIIGLGGRAEILRAISADLNLPAGDIVPSKEELAAMVQKMAANPPEQKGAEPGEKPTENPVGNTVQPNFNKRGA